MLFVYTRRNVAIKYDEIIWFFKTVIVHARAHTYTRRPTDSAIYFIVFYKHMHDGVPTLIKTDDYWRWKNNERARARNNRWQ